MATAREIAEKMRKKKQKDDKTSTSAREIAEKIKKYNSLSTENVNSKYIDSFFNDARSFLTTAEKDYGGLGWGNASTVYKNRSTTWKDISTRADTIEAWLYKNKSNIDKDTYNNLYNAISELRSGGSSVLDTFKNEADHYTQFNTEDEYNQWYESYKKSVEEAERLKGLASSEQASKGWKKYTDDVAKAADEERPKGFWDKIGYYLSQSSGDTSLPLVGETSAAVKAYRNDDGYKKPNDNWTEEQKNIFGALYVTNPTEAEEYAIVTNREINKAKEEEAIKKIKESSTSGFWAGAGNTIGAIATSPLGLADYLDDLVKISEGRPLTPDGAVSPFEYSQAVKEGITTNLNENGGTLNEDIPILGGKGWGDVYGLGTSIAESFLTGAIAGGSTPGSSISSFMVNFGKGAAAGVDDALARGLTDDKAVLYGTALGLAEGIFETIGIDNLFKLGSSATIKEFFINMLKQSGIEATEEGLTSIASNIADVVIAKDKSNFSTLVAQYMAQGMSKSEAQKKAWKNTIEEVVFDAIAGAASGGISGGIATSVQNAFANNKTSRLYGNGAELVAEGKEIGGEAGTLAEKYQAKLDKGKSLSGGQINRLVEANENALISQDKAKMQTAAESRLTELGESGDVSSIAKAIVKQALGENLTRSEKALLQNSMYGQRVSNEISPSNVGSGEYSNAWSENIGTERVNAEAYNLAIEAVQNDDATQKALLDVAKTMQVNTDEGIIATETNSSPAKENIVESEYEVSADGKTINKKNDKIVNIKNIESISEDGEANLTLDDGMAVKASDLAYGNNAEAIFVENIGKIKLGKSPINTTSANELYMHAMRALENNPDMTAEQAQDLIKGLEESYVYGAYNFGESNLTKNESVAFANKLPDLLRKRAYELGSRDNVSKTESSQKAIDKVKTKANPNSKKKHLGKIVFESKINEKTLSPVKQANLNGIKLLAEFTNYEFHVFESDDKLQYKMPNGAVRSANGWYVKGTNEIWIDIKSGAFGEGTMLWTAAHEIGHDLRVKTPKQWQAIANLIMETFAKNDVDVKGMLNKQIAKIERRYKANNEVLPSQAELIDMAYEEMVSDALTDMLTDGSIVNFMAEVKAKDRNLWQKIGDAIKSLLEKWGLVIDSYKGRKLETAEAQALSQFEDVFKQIQEMYRDALLEANEVNATIGARNLTDFAEAKNTNGEALFQYRAMEADESTYRDMLKKWGKMTDTQINNLFTTIDRAMDIIKDNLEVLDYAWDSDINDRAFSPVKPNSDSLYQVSLDFSTLCRKRILQQTVQAQLQEALNKPLTREEGIAIRDALMALQEEGRQIEVACALCYVESARMKSPAQIKKFLNNRESVIKDFFAGKSGGSMKDKIKRAETDVRENLHKENPNGIKGKDGSMLDPRTASLKAMPKKYADAIRDAKKGAKESYKPTAEEQKLIDVAKGMTVTDFTSPEGLENLAKNYPALFDAYTSYIRNATKSKGIEGDTWWRAGDSQKIGDVLIANMNRENGLRSQSWSDFQVIHILDYIAATIELSTRNAKEQAYSKVPDYVELMGQTGVMINMSLIPTRNFNGSLEYDSVEGMAYKRALELREKYPATAGTICIGVDNKQIQMLLADATIDYVIPYHKSGMAASVRKLMHIPTWSQYEEYQSEKNLSKKDAEAQAKKYGVKLLEESDPNYHKHTAFSEWFDLEVAKQIAKMENGNPSNKAMQKKYGVMYGGYMAMQDAANNYLKLCAERGIAPKFSHENADFTAEDNYWKLLIDRKMVNNATGEIIEQRAIKPIFDEGEVLRILNDELERYPSVKADQDYATRKVTEKFLSGEIKSGMSAEAIAEVMKKPVDNITNTNIVASSESDTMLSDRIKNNFYQEFLEDMPIDEYNKLTVKKPIKVSKDVYAAVNSARTQLYGDAMAEDIPIIDIINLGEYGVLNSDDFYFIRNADRTDFSIIKHTKTLKGRNNKYVDIRGRQKGNPTNRGNNSENGRVGIEGEDNPSNRNNRPSTDKSASGENANETQFVEEANGRTGTGNSSRDFGREIKTSDRDSEGNELSIGQQEFFKDSKVRDAEGNLLVAYHVTPNDIFYEFDPSKHKSNSGTDVWGKGFYFSDEKASYYWSGEVGGKNELICYLNVKKPFVVGNNAKAPEDLKNYITSTDAYKESTQYRKDYLGDNASRWYSFLRFSVAEDANAILQELGYDGIIVGNNYEIVIFDSNQAKLTTNTNPTTNPDIRYSERDPEASNRAILANALEGVAQNDIEKNKLNEYKEKIGLINAEEQRLSEIQKQLFTKGGVEPKQRKALQFEAKQIANRINTYDRQLLRLEATKPLQSVLNREKEMARKRQKQKDAEAMSKYKEKVAQTTRELITRNQESRKKAIESREKTAMRHKIQKVVGDLNTLLLKPTKERHVPEELKIAVAEALSIVNLDTVDADTRVAKYNDLIAKAKDPDVIASLTATRDRILNQGNKLADKLTKLKDAYGKIQNSTDDSLRSMYDDVIYNKIESVQEKVGKTPLRNMTLAQLESVYELYKMVLTTVRDSNKAFAEDLKMTRQALGSNTFAEIKENNKARDTIKHPFLEKSLWQYLKPMQAMKTIGSGTLQKLWNNILYGQEVFAQDYDEAVKFAKEMKDKYGYKKWNLKKLYSFESKSGKTMKISLEQMMSIYAYSKRAQADEHIEYGGIVLNEGIIEEKNKLGKTVKVKVNDSTAYRLNRMQVGQIIDTLEKEAPGAKAFVDEMQKYLSETMGAKGNEVSMKMYGINLFKEEHYFPLKSSKDFMEAANAKLKGDVKIKNKGMTKSTVEHARNPIVLENFLDVWGNHINEMAMYHGLVLPLEDFSRTLNYSFKADEKLNTDAESVKTALKSAFGDNAEDYLNNLLKAINGGVLHDSSAQSADKMISKFKKAKVMASLSVVVQQPTAIIRAMGIIEPKYFVAQNFNHKQTWEELKKYCPTAIIKETGSFDTNMGRTIVDMIKDERGFTDKVGDALGKAPAWMDEMGWNMIWRALKNKVATEQKLSGEELLKECGKQMTLIINETQVYDSVMSRNELMRSKSTFTKMATAFMAEPTTVANMIYGAALDIKRGKKGIAGKTIAATIGSVVINGLVSSFVYALRDDDEDETFLEKYLSAATTEVLDGLNPLTYIPFIKDAYSLFQGYKVERTDMALIGDVYDALNTFYNVLDPEAYEGMSREEIAKHIYENSVPMLTSICDMFGLPVGNILRDAKAIIINDNLSMSQTASAGTRYAFKEGAMGTLPKIVQNIIGTDSKQDKLYDAIVNGDTAYLKRLKSGYKDDKAYETAVRKALRENDPRIREAAQARIDGNIAEYTRIVKEIKAEGFFSQDTIVASVNAEINAINKGESSNTNNSTGEDKESSIYKIEDYYASIVGGDQASAYVVKEEIINTDIANGKDRDEAESNFNSRFASYLREEYEDGYISASEAKRMLINYGGKSEEDAASKVQYWAFKQEYPDYDDLSEESVDKYYSEVEPYGISINVYYDYSKQRSKCKGADNNGDGKTDSGSVKAEVLRVINSLPISRSQKDALYYLNGWSAKTIYEAPWH